MPNKRKNCTASECENNEFAQAWWTAEFGEELLLVISPGKLGLTIKADKFFGGGVVIVDVSDDCTFKDLVGIGWRITSVDDVPVTSVDDVQEGDVPRYRVMKFIKSQIHNNSNLAEWNEKADADSLTQTTGKNAPLLIQRLGRHAPTKLIQLDFARGIIRNAHSV